MSFLNVLVIKMHPTHLIAALCIASSFCLVNSKKLPSFITPCKRNTPNFNDCYANAIRKLRPYMGKGIPELGIPPCDPIVIPKIALQQPDQGSLSFDAILTNVTFYGGLDYIIHKMEADIDKGTFFLQMSFPKLKMESKYRANGKILVVQFVGDGDAHGEFNNVTVYADWHAKRINKNGKEHFKIVQDSSKITLGEMSLVLDDLFKNNQALTDNTNKLIRDNVEVLSEEVKPVVEKALIALFSSVVSEVNDRYSIDDLYPL